MLRTNATSFEPTAPPSAQFFFVAIYINARPQFLGPVPLIGVCWCSDATSLPNSGLHPANCPVHLVPVCRALRRLPAH